MGSDNSHLRLTVRSRRLRVHIYLGGKRDISLGCGDSIDMAFHPQINGFNGNISVQMIIDDIHSDSLKEEEIQNQPQYKIYDNRNKNRYFIKRKRLYKDFKTKHTCICEKANRCLKQQRLIQKFHRELLIEIILNNATLYMFLTILLIEKLFESILEQANPTKFTL